MRGILINPWFKSITEVQIGEDIQDIYRIMSNPLGPKVSCFTVGRSWHNGDILYVDDEGLLKSGMRLFNIDGQPLVGNGLILGRDAEGNSVDAKSMLIQIQCKIAWTNLETR